jgi:two-component system chemotaxis sensor kinase CheA
MTDEPNEEQVEIITEFVSETRDMIDELEPTIISMEDMVSGSTSSSDEDKETLNAIFRLFHSMKGGAGFLGFANVVECTHTAENLLDQLRNGELALTDSHVDLLCKSCDFSKAALDYIENNLNDDGIAIEARQLIEAFNEETSAEAPGTPAANLPEINLDAPAAALDTPETRKKFLSESDDLLQKMEADLLKLSETPEDKPLVDSLFRGIHSLKGDCGFMGFVDFEKLLHSLETLVELVKSSDIKNVNRVVDMLLEMVDVFRDTINDIAAGGIGEIYGLEMYLELINNYLPEDRQVEVSVPSTKLGDILVRQGAVKPEEIEQALESQGKPIGEILVDKGLVKKEQVDKALKAQEKMRPVAKRIAAGNGAKRQDIRVDLSKLDSLIDLIGEIVIAENMVVHNPDLRDLELENFNKAAGHLGKIVRELQEMAMVIRMLPISGQFRRMIRLVHDLSRKNGKKIDLQLSGENTEVDKTVIEKITDPMVHLIRNSLDHGIGSPEERMSVGKPETGVIKLEARHEEGEVQITISDDGRGMDRDKLIAKAVAKGLIDGDGSQLSDSEALQLIFEPGFSMAEKITDISGRGVGMDVVRSNLEEIKGRVDVQSELGKGTTITLHIPLTLAIIDGMLIRVGSSRYIIPILSIRESFRPEASAITVTPEGRELVRVRDRLIPVLRLHEIHNLQPDSTKLIEGLLIVLEARGGNLCLFVDELLGQQQTVIKGLSEYIGKLGEVSGVSGCTILGDGEVCLILDVQALSEEHSGGEEND